MITKVVIKDNKNSPIRYLSKLKAFKNGTEYTFKEGVNVIVGKNGCGKTTLMKLLERYLLVDYTECSKGDFNNNIDGLLRTFKSNEGILDGVGVYADYQRNTFRLCHAGERKEEDNQKNFKVFSEFMTQRESSMGESVLVAINSLFGQMFSKDANLFFDYLQFKEDYYPHYAEYIKAHKIEGDEWTILMDEPDRNLDLENIMQIKGILSFHKPHTQIIAVVHNPLLIVSLSRTPEVNIIEMTKGYVKKMESNIKKLLK